MWDLFSIFSHLFEGNSPTRCENLTLFAFMCFSITQNQHINKAKNEVRSMARNEELKKLFGCDENVLSLYWAMKNPWARRTPGWCTLDTFLMSMSLFCSVLFQEIFTGNTDFIALTIFSLNCCERNRRMISDTLFCSLFYSTLLINFKKEKGASNMTHVESNTAWQQNSQVQQRYQGSFWLQALHGWIS